MQPTPSHWAYLAGFIDGDGCVHTGISEGYRTFIVQIAQKDRAVLQLLRKTFGGFISTHAATGMHSLTWSSRNARIMASEVAPYLRFKAAKAEAMAAVRTVPDSLSNKPELRIKAVDKAATLWAYVAGLVDADGSIGFYGGATQRQRIPKLCIHQKDRDFLLALREEIGFGSVCRRGYTGPNRDHMHYLVFGSQQSKRLCELIYPYLLIKQDKAGQVRNYAGKLRRHDALLDRPEVPTIVAQYEAGHTMKHVAEQVGLPVDRVNAILRRLGKTRTLSESQKLRRAREAA